MTELFLWFFLFHIFFRGQFYSLRHSIRWSSGHFSLTKQNCTGLFFNSTRLMLDLVELFGWPVVLLKKNQGIIKVKGNFDLDLIYAIQPKNVKEFHNTNVILVGCWRETQKRCQSLDAKLLEVVEVFLSEPQWWTDMTNAAFPWATLMVCPINGTYTSEGVLSKPKVGDWKQTYSSQNIA